MRFINIHTHNSTSEFDTLAIVNTYPNSFSPTSYFSIGIHPWHINDEQIEQDLLIVEKKLHTPYCLAIGECGLDKITSTDYTTQIELFKKHIHLSEKYQKPLIIHCVKAYNDLILIRKHLSPIQPWIVHGFNKNLQIASDLIKHGIYISFGAALLHNKRLQTVIKNIPLNRIFLETDTTDEPIKNIYNTFALLKQKDIAFIKKQINQNFNSIFRL